MHRLCDPTHVGEEIEMGAMEEPLVSQFVTKKLCTQTQLLRRKWTRAFCTEDVEPKVSSPLELCNRAWWTIVIVQKIGWTHFLNFVDEICFPFFQRPLRTKALKGIFVATGEGASRGA